jgi:molybdopterin-containing oxidoreductase family membrane subunit
VNLFRSIAGVVRLIVNGNKAYYTWCAALLVLIGVGASAYIHQLRYGLGVTHMSDQVSWAFYIGNFTFLVGVAAAAIMLVIPAYVYHWGPVKEVVILGELLAISAVVMCLLFVTCDMGRPDRAWHMIPFVGVLNFPRAILAWDVVVLNLYLVLNGVIVAYLLYKAYMDRHVNHRFLWPLVISTIPFAVSIHTVTACIYAGMVARPYWNAAVLAPRFLASAFCSGPAVLLILLQILRHTTRLKIQDAAIWKVAELMAYSMAMNLFLTGMEAFKEFYAGGHHAVYTEFYFVGFHGHHGLVPYAWVSVACDLIAFLLLLVPRTRMNPITLNVGCLLIYTGTYIEKGIGLLIPGFTPDTLGEIREYTPSLTELQIAAGIFSVGFLLFTLMVKVAVPVMLGEFRYAQVKLPPLTPPARDAQVAQV